MSELEIRFSQWKRLLPVYVGAVVTLLAATLAELPLYLENYWQAGGIMTITPWFGVSFVLFLAGLIPSVPLLVAKSWRTLPLAQRLPVALGFLAGSWGILLALDVRLLPIDPPTWVHISVAILGPILALVYWVYRRASVRSELFP